MTGVLFDGGPNEPKTLDEVLGQAIGAASMCWEDINAAGVFDSTRAKVILDEVTDFLGLELREAWLEGYKWALSNLQDQGVLVDAVMYAKQRNEERT